MSHVVMSQPYCASVTAVNSVPSMLMSDLLLHHAPYMCVVCFHLHNVGILTFRPFFLLRTEVIPLLFVSQTY